MTIMSRPDADANSIDVRHPLLLPAPGRGRIERSVASARDWLFGRQASAGFWCEPLEGDTTVESYWIILDAFLGRRADDQSRALAQFIREQMLPDGGWPQYRGGPADLSVSCLSYLALKLAGYHADDAGLQRSRDMIVSLGGAERASTYVKYHFAMFGQCPWSGVPAIPPEMMLLPEKGPFTIYDMSSWSRTIFVPLSIIYAHRPVIKVAPERGVQELFTSDPGSSGLSSRRYRGLRFGGQSRAQTWEQAFFFVDHLLRLYERGAAALPLRKRALLRATAWMLERLDGSDGLSAILPAMANSIMALRCLGYANEHALVREQLGHLDCLLRQDERGKLRMQPCLSPVWDTLQSCHALIEAGVNATHPSLRKAASWLLAKQCRSPGDWSRKTLAMPGGWYFEGRNEPYPDVDDTCMALMVLRRARALEPEPEQAWALERGLAWMLAMQNEDGGWASFDRGNDKQWLVHVPFADHNAMIDPSTADITGRVLECLSHFPGFDAAHPVVRRALNFLRQEQESDGSWYGRWGVNYLYGTWQVLRGLRAIGDDMNQPCARRAVRWLLEHQNPDGGWGESIRSYDDVSHKGRGASTPSQTAWAVMGLLSAHSSDSQAVRRGVHYLLERQDSSGTWDEECWTGTGFPKVFYLNYHGYRHYFPLLALGQYQADRFGR
jgi:squalene-hopene/tetraprenyl-beta-curcumene cyclase